MPSFSPLQVCGSTLYQINRYGNYWSSSVKSDDSAGERGFVINFPQTASSNISETETIPVVVAECSRGYGRSVRLVQDAETYDITIPTEIENGKITADKTVYTEGESVTLTVTPDEGYVLKTLTVTTKDGEGTTVETTKQEDGTYTFTMPAGAVSIAAEFAETYDITLPAKVENGEITADKNSYIEGETVTLTVTPDKGYALKTLTVTTKDGEGTTTVETTEQKDGTYTFTMPAGAVSIAAEFAETYDITLPAEVANGEISADKNSYIAGETVTLTVTPKTGYKVKSVTVIGEDETKIIVSAVEDADNQYQFTMPAGKVTVSVVFEKSEATAMDAIRTNSHIARKVVKNGKVVILQGADTYSLLGGLLDSAE